MTKGCIESEGTCSSSMLVIDTISKPSRYWSSASPKVHVSGSQRTRNYSTHVYRLPCLIRLGSERANMCCIAALSPGASLLRSGSTVGRVFLLWPGRLGGMWRVIFAVLAGSPWEWARDARKGALYMESCLEAPSTTRGGMACRGIYSRLYPRWSAICRLWGRPPKPASLPFSFTIF